MLKIPTSRAFTVQTPLNYSSTDSSPMCMFGDYTMAIGACLCSDSFKRAYVYTTDNVYEGEEKEDLRQDWRSSGREEMIVLICDWRVWTV